MAVSPVLETPRLTLEPFSAPLVSERYVSWLNDPQVVRFSENRHRVHTLASCRAYVDGFVDTPNYLWAILTRQPAGRHVGNINAYVDPANEIADIGLMIGERSFWGRGYGGEAWAAVCDYLLRKARLRKVTGGALAANGGMLEIMKRIGMQPDGVRTAHYIVEGAPADLVHMAFFRRSWLDRYPEGPFAAGTRPGGKIEP